MRRGLGTSRTKMGRVGGDLPRSLFHREKEGRAEMTADEFEHLDDLQAELWIARRFREFINVGFPPDLSLIFATHAEVGVPRKPAPEGGICEIFERPNAA